MNPVETMTATPIDVYRRQIENELQAGNATEHTHRPALETLIESLLSGVAAINELRNAEPRTMRLRSAHK